jgi:hypothetical protein
VSSRWLMTLDSYANATYGRSISSAVAGGICVSCGHAAHPFRTADAEALYPAMGLCERCQDAQKPISDTIVPFNQNYRVETP